MNIFLSILDNQYKCLTDPEQDKYNYIDLIKAWDNSFDNRLKVLRPVKSKVNVCSYLGSFKAIKLPIGIGLVSY